MKNKISIDEMINQLTMAKHRIGGDKNVSFWIAGNMDTFYPETNQIDAPIVSKLACDGSGVSFEIVKDNTWHLSNLVA